MPSLGALREQLRLSLWFVPAVFAGCAVLLAFLLLGVDRRLAGEVDFASGGTAEGARSVLSAIAQSMLSFTGLVFSVTMLVLQLASSQLSPRVMRTFLRDRGNQVVLGLFVATFVFTLVVLREVRADTDDLEGFVPAVAVWAAFALLLASVAAFIWYIDHMAHAIRAVTVIGSIWRETMEAIDRLYPDPATRMPAATTGIALGPPSLHVQASEAGVVIAVDDEGLLGLAREHGGVIAIEPRVGAFVPAGGTIALGWGDWPDTAADRIRDRVSLGPERTMEQDVAFGLRQLVDIAVRALSPGTNDPTTAVQVLDRVHDLLRTLGGRAYPPVERFDSGEVRLIRPADDFDDHLALALDEIRIAGAGQIQVVARLEQLVADLAEVVPDWRRPAVERQARAVADLPPPRHAVT